MDRLKSWRQLLAISGVGYVLCASPLLGLADDEPAKPRSNALIYIPKMRPELGPRKLFKPAPGSRAEADQVRAGILPHPSNSHTYQRPPAIQTQELATSQQNYSLVGPNGATSSGSGSQAAVAGNGAQRAPFIANRGPLLPANAVQRLPASPQLPQPVPPAIAKNSSHGVGAESQAQFVAVPMVGSAPSAEPNSLSTQVTSAAKPISQAKSNIAQTTVTAPPAVMAKAELDGVIVPTRQVSPAAGTRVSGATAEIVPTAGTTMADLSLVALVENDTGANQQITVPNPTVTISTPAPLPALIPSNGNITPALISLPSVNVASPTVPMPSVPLPMVNSQVVVTPPQVLLPSPPPALPNIGMISIPKPIEIPALVRTNAAVVSEPPKLAVPSLQPPVPADVHQQPGDVLVSELEREMAEMQAARDLLRKSVEDSDMRAREVSARTNVAQAAQLQTLVAQVVTKVRSEQDGKQAATTDPNQRTRVITADDLPHDFITIGSRLYSKGLFEDAEVAFRAAIDHATTRRDQTFANYLLATSLRRQGNPNGAAQYYRVVAVQNDEPELRDLARWQLKHLHQTAAAR